MSQVYKNIIAKTQFQPNKEWLQIKTIEMHTGGEPLRVLIDGFPELKGKTILESRNYCKENFDYLRTALMFEPRGHADMYGCILLPPNDKFCDFGIIFLHNEGYSTMCGHAIIAISTLAILMHWIDVEEGDNMIKIDKLIDSITSFLKERFDIMKVDLVDKISSAVSRIISDAAGGHGVGDGF